MAETYLAFGVASNPQGFNPGTASVFYVEGKKMAITCFQVLFEGLIGKMRTPVYSTSSSRVKIGQTTEQFCSDSSVVVFPVEDHVQSGNSRWFRNKKRVMTRRELGRRVMKTGCSTGQTWGNIMAVHTSMNITRKDIGSFRGFQRDCWHSDWIL